MNEEIAIKSLKRLIEQLKLKAEIKYCKIEGSFLIVDFILRAGGTFRKIERYSTEIALSLKALSEPLIYTITNQGIIRMEVMIRKQNTIFFKDIINENEFKYSKAKLPLLLGKLRNGKVLVSDLSKMPHLLISGSTGSGKSVLLQSIINSLLVSKRNINLALIDPKRVEFSYYDKLSNLYGPIARNVDSSIRLLRDIIKEMNRRFFILEKYNVRDILNYENRMPFVVVIIDELADLMMTSKKLSQELICKIAQKSRACGIHLIVATQRPSVDVITGLIKANFPSRISCRVSSAIDSRTIFGKNGAETLCGEGDAIVDCYEYPFTRFKSSYIKEDEIVSIVNRNKSYWRRIWTS